MPAPRRLPLRLRLSIVAVVLVATGLLIAGLATRYELQSFLIDRLDRQLSAAAPPVLFYFARGDNDPGARQQVLGVLPQQSYTEVLAANDRVVASQFFGTGSAPAALKSAAGSAPAGASSHDGYRLVVVPASQTAGLGLSLRSGNRLVIAVPLNDVDSTLNRLAVLEVVIGVGVLGFVALIAFVAVRRELKPLQRIEDTAAAIAAGDLSRRIAEEDSGTEVGSLARSLNAMLTQIELAFDERRRSEERLRRFVADASHELKTPLTSVRGFAELFRRGASTRPGDLALAMSRIEAEAVRMTVLVEDLLLLANLDQGRPLAQDRFDLAAVLAEMVADHSLLYPTWPISFQSDGEGEVVGDELRVRQAVANLLANARAHTPPGTNVTVRLWTNAAQRIIEIQDDGPGVADDDVPHLFERFFRVDPSRARRSGGSGLGLSIVEAIAEAHGGLAKAESTKGLGATFVIALPTEGRRQIDTLSAGGEPDAADGGAGSAKPAIEQRL